MYYYKPDRHPSYGFSLFEAIISLALISLLITTVSVQLRTNRSQVDNNKAALHFTQELQRARLEALRKGLPQTLVTQFLDCQTGDPIVIYMFPNGFHSISTACAKYNGGIFSIDVVSGRVIYNGTSE